MHTPTCKIIYKSHACKELKRVWQVMSVAQLNYAVYVNQNNST